MAGWKLNRKVTLLFTVYEEVGHGGSFVPADTEEMISVDTVSYTHLDVYKRQAQNRMERDHNRSQCSDICDCCDNRVYGTETGAHQGKSVFQD